jgi:hypothetical protein
MSDFHEAEQKVVKPGAVAKIISALPIGAQSTDRHVGMYDLKEYIIAYEKKILDQNSYDEFPLYISDTWLMIGSICMVLKKYDHVKYAYGLRDLKAITYWFILYGKSIYLINEKNLFII